MAELEGLPLPVPQTTQAQRASRASRVSRASGSAADSAGGGGAGGIGAPGIEQEVRVKHVHIDHTARSSGASVNRAVSVSSSEAFSNDIHWDAVPLPVPTAATGSVPLPVPSKSKSSSRKEKVERS